jgi:hypothetical protein
MGTAGVNRAGADLEEVVGCARNVMPKMPIEGEKWSREG